MAELRRIEFADPASDLQVAIEKGDHRFIGIMGYAMEVPGVAIYDFHERYRDRYGVRIIEGTSDVITSDEHRRLIGVARKYAKKYNELVLERIESAGEKGKG